MKEHNMTDELNTAELQAFVLTGAAELAQRWITDHENGAALRTHMAHGAGLEMLIQLAPAPAIGLRLVDSDQSFVALRTFTPLA